MKKLLSAILISAMLLTLLPCAVFAAEDNGLENAILTAKSKIEIPEEYSEFSSDSYSDQGETIYNLYWTTSAEEYSYEKGLTVSINSHGDITSYDNYDYKRYSSEPRFSSYTEDDIKNIAKTWLFSVNPSWEESLPDEAISLNSAVLVHDTSIYVFFERRINGLPFCTDFATVSVDTLTGEVRSMNASWTYTEEIPSVTEAISAEAAEDAFFEKSPLTLSYMNTENGVILVYKPENEDILIDARTGEEFNYFNYGYSSKNEAATEEAADDTMAIAGGSSSSQLTESELKNIAEVNELLSEAELCSLADNMPNTNIKNLTFMSISYDRVKNDKENTQYIARLYYESTEEDSYGGAYVNFDAKTGELRNFSSYGEKYENKKVSVSYEKAVETATDFINTYGGDAANKVKNDSTPPIDAKNIYEYSLRFNRYENDIPYTLNGFTLRIDPVTGNITSYYKTWNEDLIFESPDGIISPEDARTKLMEKSSMVLSYAHQQGESKTEPVIGMAYTINPEIPTTISAKSGEILNYLGEVYDPQENEIRYPTDISGHYAEAAITKLIESGFLELGEDETEFRPDEPITQKDLIAFVYGLRSGYIPYPIDTETLARTIRNLDLSGIEIEPEGTATREFGVQLIVSVLDYDKAASINGIFKTVFTDEAEISPELLGYVAIAQGLKLVSGNGNGYFKPQELLTRADAAIMIYNYLAR